MLREAFVEARGSNSVIIGIDPGKAGAVAFLSPPWCNYGPPKLACVHDTPVSGGEYQLLEMRMMLLHHAWLNEREQDVPEAVFVETTHAWAGQRAQSTAAQFEGIGLWRGIVAGVGWRHETITAHGGHWGKLVGLPPKADKTVHREHAIRLFPHLEDQLKRVRDDGRADALLIAEAGRRLREQRIS